MKYKYRLKKSRIEAILLVAFMTIFLLNSGFSYAASSKSTLAKSTSSSTSGSSPIIQSFNADSNVYPGMMVSLDPKSTTSVTPLTNHNVTKMLGVVVPLNSAQLSLTPSSSTSQQVLIAESGRYQVLVSNEGGPITSGEDLTMSSVAGVAMKAGTSDKTSIGQAQGNFNGKAGVISNVQVKKSNGSVNNYTIGSIIVNVDLGENTAYTQNTSGLPQFIIQAAYNLANKPVSPARIYLGFVIIFAVIIVVGTMFYSGTRNGIISIGRNPLSQKSIAKGLLQTMVAGLLVFCLGIGIVYAVIVL